MPTYDELQNEWRASIRKIEKDYRDSLRPPKKLKSSPRELLEAKKRYKRKKETGAIFGKPEKKPKKEKPVFVDPEIEILKVLKHGMKGTI